MSVKLDEKQARKIATLTTVFGLAELGLFSALAVFDRQRIDRSIKELKKETLPAETRERYGEFARQDGGPYDRKTTGNVFNCVPPSSAAIGLGKGWATVIAVALVAAGHLVEGGVYLARAIKWEL